jgi:nucleoside-diphosphate-sugar epimerase
MSSTFSHLHLPVEDLDHVMSVVGFRWERLRGQRLLLTGGTGFIGKWLLATFLHANRRLNLSARIVVLSRNPEAFLNEFPELRNATEIEWLTGDVRDLVPEMVGDCRFAIHAATDVVANSTPFETLETCTVGTQRVLNVMTSRDTPCRVLLLSSGAIYGRTPPGFGAIPEDWTGGPDPLMSLSAYGEGKRISELLGAMAVEAHPHLEVSIARCFAFVGPHLPLDKHFAIGNFIGAAMRDEDIQIHGTPVRSYLYASDLAHWLWVMLFDAPSGRAYNVGGTAPISISELASRVNYLVGGTGNVHIGHMPKPDVAPQAYVPSIERISDELGLNPCIQLDEAIIRTTRWAANILLKNNED